MMNTPLLRPEPRRSFQLTPTSTGSSAPPTPSQDSSDYSRLEAEADGEKTASRTRSILNLTSSTLYGIYSPYGNENASTTPWGTGAQTPSLRTNADNLKVSSNGAFPQPKLRRSPLSHHHSHIYRDRVVPLTLRTILLFFFGVAYGLIITQLHDTQQVAPVKVEGIEGYSWRYLTSWGVAGILLGSLLPWVDILWDDAWGKDEDTTVPEKQPKDSRPSSEDDENSLSSPGSDLGADWNPVVRSIGAFIGIAFAIVSSLPTPAPCYSHPANPLTLQRKLPWQSTLQVSLTLALVNPVLWYLVDRSKPGFLLSALVGITGTAVLLGVNPDMVPAPAAAVPSPHAGATAAAVNMSYEGLAYDGLIFSNESIGVGTWIASVLFCSCVCFGNIGRRLAVGGVVGRGSIS